MVKPWFVYILAYRKGGRLCYYTGASVDVGSRLVLHRNGRGAKSLRGATNIRLVATSAPLPKGQALRLEYAIKACSHGEKKNPVEVIKRLTK